MLAFATRTAGEQEEGSTSTEEDDGRAFPFISPSPLFVVESWRGPTWQSRTEATSKRAGLTASASLAHLSVARTVTTAVMRCGGRGDPVLDSEKETL